MGDSEGGGVVLRPRQMHLHGHRLGCSTAITKSVDDPTQAPRRLVHRDQPVSPAADSSSSLLADRRAEQRRGPRRQAPQLRPVDTNEPIMVHLLAPQQRADDVDTLDQAGVALRFRRPSVAGDVLVERLARAKGSPEAVGKEFAERCDRLRDDRRVVSLTRRGHDTERDRRRLHRRTEPRPRVPGMSLALAPRSEMIRAHCRLKPGGFGSTMASRSRDGANCSWDAWIPNDWHANSYPSRPPPMPRTEPQVAQPCRRRDPGQGPPRQCSIRL